MWVNGLLVVGRLTFDRLAGLRWSFNATRKQTILTDTKGVWYFFFFKLLFFKYCCVKVCIFVIEFLLSFIILFLCCVLAMPYKGLYKVRCFVFGLEKCYM